MSTVMTTTVVTAAMMSLIVSSVTTAPVVSLADVSCAGDAEEVTATMAATPAMAATEARNQPDDNENSQNTEHTS